MNIRRVAVTVVLCLSCLLVPKGVFAGVEVTGVVGTLLGGELDSVLNTDFSSITKGFKNASLYGARVTYMLGIFGVEGSYVTSPNGLDITFFDFPIELDARIRYLEANALLVPLPGPVSPYVTGGIGHHSFNFDLSFSGEPITEVKVAKSGFNFGAGVRVAFSKLVVRVEGRDHVTKIGPADFDLEALADELGFNKDQTLHNVEVSVSAGIRF